MEVLSSSPHSSKRITRVLTTWWEQGSLGLLKRLPASVFACSARLLQPLLLFTLQVVSDSSHLMDYSTLGSQCVWLNSCPLSRWCCVTIPTSVFPFFFYLQSLPASESFPLSRLFTSAGQSIGASVFSISPFNEYSGLISFRIDWFDLLTIQGTLKNLLQQHSSKASILQCPAFFMVQCSHPWLLEKP